MLEEDGARSALADLHDIALPPMSLESYCDTLRTPRRVQTFVDLVAASDAVVLGTPVHHASFSGLLKGALDHLSPDAFDGKSVGLIANVGSPRGGSVACDHLRAVVKALGGWAVPTQVVTHSSDLVGTSLDPAVDARLRRMARELTWFFERGTELTEPGVGHRSALRLTAVTS
jgi:NAD(P)H-dependent FMN reductase